MPTGIYERKLVDCSAACGRMVSATHSKSGLCRRCATRAWKKANAERVNAHNRKYNAASAGSATRWSTRLTGISTT